MDEATMDGLARRLAGRTHRRSALRGVGGALAGGVLAALRLGPTRAYSDRCERFSLSAGKNPNKEIDVDDDLTVYLNGERIFRDNDGVIGIGLEPIEPIHFRAKVGDKLRVVAKDGQGPCRSLSPLWLHCRDGGSPKKLTNGVDEDCKDGRPPRTFFDETFRI
jgi:hypothetical protein